MVLVDSFEFLLIAKTPTILYNFLDRLLKNATVMRFSVIVNTHASFSGRG